MTVYETEEEISESELTRYFAQELTERRNFQGLTLEDLAERAGVHRTTLGLIERGRRGISIAVADRVARALGFHLSDLVLGAENRELSDSGSHFVRQRIVSNSYLRNCDKLFELTRLTPQAVKYAIEHTYQTFDMIDDELVQSGSEPISHLVEYANLSSMLGNILGAGLAEASDGLYTRNRPHAYPDLVPQQEGLPDLELKTALEKNSPKGHLPKDGTYITFRYVLASPEGVYERGKNNRGNTAWIWEVRVGDLTESDFAFSSTDGDSGKTAVIKSDSFKNMPVVFFDPRFMPYTKTWNGLSPMS